MVWILIFTGSISTVLYGLNFRLIPFLGRLGLVDPRKGPPAVYPSLFLMLFALYLIALVSILKKRSNAPSPYLILGFALLFRTSLFFMPQVLSSDIYRYVWDGRVQAAGINPYAHPPSAEELAFLRDEQIFPFINRKWAPTIYPPGAQILFAGIYALFPDSVAGLKFIILLFDLFTIALLLRILKKAGMDPHRVLLYAWSPLVLFELAGSGHLEALMLPFVLVALLARTEGKPVLAGGALGVATLIKLYPAALLPALWKRRDLRFPLAFGITVLLGYAPYFVGAGTKVVGFLPYYVQPWEDFNVGLRDFLGSALAPFIPSARWVSMLLLLACLLFVAMRLILQEQSADFFWRGYHMAGAYLLFLPISFHPWYLVWLLPFLSLYPSWGWLYLSGSLSLSYLAYIHDPPIVPLGIRLVEFLPLFLLLLAQFVRHHHTEVCSGKVMALTMEKPR